MLSNAMQASIKWAVALSVLIAMTWGIVSWMGKQDTLPIKYVRVEGELRRVAKEDITDAISGITASGYFAVNTSRIATRLEKLEWIKSVRISRVWPDTVSITLAEQTPVAVWNQQFLLNEKGDIFRPQSLLGLESLPKLSGEDSRAVLLLESLATINESIKGKENKIGSLERTAHGSWFATTQSGVKLNIGYRDPMKLIGESINLLKSLDIGVLSRVNTIDMRYPNGMAVIWKEGEGLLQKTVEKNNLQQLNKLKV